MTTPGNHTPSENDLITGAIQGDSGMQKLLYDRFAGKMYGVCLRYSNQVEDANDILQEGFIKVFRNLPKYRGEGSFEGWVRRIFVNTAIEHYRKRSKTFQVTEAQENTVEDQSLDALDNLAQKDLVNLINQLSPGYKMVFNMHVIEGYSHKEIAAELGITEGTSKSQLARAKGVLKSMIRERRKV